MENLPFSGNPPVTTTNTQPLPPTKIQAKIQAKKQVTEEEHLFDLARRNADKRTIAELRLNKFATAFLATNGNAVQSAMNAFGIKDPQIASAIGHFYARKVRELGMLHLETKGVMTLGQVYELLANRARTEKDPEFFKMLSKLFGIDQHVLVDKKEDRSVNVNILQDYRKTQEEFGFGDVSEGEIIEETEE